MKKIYYTLAKGYSNLRNKNLEFHVNQIKNRLNPLEIFKMNSVNMLFHYCLSKYYIKLSIFIGDSI